MPKYYTTNGDDGRTGVLGENRVSKNHARIKAVGAVDDATEALGFARALSGDQELNDLVKAIQVDLYQIMSLLVLEKADPEKFPELEPTRVQWLESMIAKYEKDLTPPTGFIHPGENLPSSGFGMARTRVRFAEREVVQLNEDGLLISEQALTYLNRLSSLCFVLELYCSDTPPPQIEK
jgi:cob(I)alamin adenosyltransferase